MRAEWSVVSLVVEKEAVVASSICENAEVDDVLVSAVKNDSDSSGTVKISGFFVLKDDWRDACSLEESGRVERSSLMVDAEELLAESNSSLKCELLL